MKRIVRAMMVWAIVALSAGLPTAHATPAKQPISDAAFNAIVKQAWEAGIVTPAQRALVLTRPDLAVSTIDPTSAKPDYELPGYVPESTEVRGAPLHNGGGKSFTAATVSTTSRDRYIVYDNWLKSVLARYHFVVAWSYDGTSVIGTPSSYTYISDCAGSCTNYGITSNNQYPNYSNGRLYAWTVPLLAKWGYCKAAQCDDLHTPSVRCGVYYNGTYNYTFLNA